jgi:uncharacterized membrane protein
MTPRSLLGLLLLLGTAVAGTPEYVLIPLPRLHPDHGGQAVDVNSRRQASGVLRTPDLPTDRAVIWDVAPDNSATVTDIGVIAGRRMLGRGLNNHGHMTGYSSGPGGEFGFRYAGAAPVQLENPFETPPDGGTFPSLALKINDDGWICGHCSTSTNNNGPFVAVLWDPSGIGHELGTLGGTGSFGADLSMKYACGTSGIVPGSSASRAFRWDFDTRTMERLEILPVPTHVYGVASGVNNHGDVAGASSAAPLAFGPDTLGVVWYGDGTVRQLDAIGTPGTDDIFARASDVSDAGWVVGTSSLGAVFAVRRAWHPILWLPDGTLVDLHPLLPAGAFNGSASEISDSGWICGIYSDGTTGISTPYVLRPTPATQVLMLLDHVDRLDLGRIGHALDAQLRVALGKLEDGKDRTARLLLAVFAFEVRLLERFKRLDDIEAGSLLAVAKDALATLEGE